MRIWVMHDLTVLLLFALVHCTHSWAHFRVAFRPRHGNERQTGHLVCYRGLLGGIIGGQNVLGLLSSKTAVNNANAQGFVGTFEDRHGYIRDNWLFKKDSSTKNILQVLGGEDTSQRTKQLSIFIESTLMSICSSKLRTPHSLKSFFQFSLHFAHYCWSLIGQSSVQLHQTGSSCNLVKGIITTSHTSNSNNRQLP